MTSVLLGPVVTLRPASCWYQGQRMTAFPWRKCHLTRRIHTPPAAFLASSIFFAVPRRQMLTRPSAQSWLPCVCLHLVARYEHPGPRP